VGEITKGPWAGRVYGGQSVAADKTGKIIAVAKDRDRDIAIVSINPAK
jgi:predicted amidohydrolase